MKEDLRDIILEFDQETLNSSTMAPENVTEEERHQYIFSYARVFMKESEEETDESIIGARDNVGELLEKIRKYEEGDYSIRYFGHVRKKIMFMKEKRMFKKKYTINVDVNIEGHTYNNIYIADITSTINLPLLMDKYSNSHRLKYLTDFWIEMFEDGFRLINSVKSFMGNIYRGLFDDIVKESNKRALENFRQDYKKHFDELSSIFVGLKHYLKDH